MKIGRAAGCVGLLGLAACGRDAGPAGTTRTDSAGIEIVESGGIDRVLAWEFRRLFTLGGADDGPEAFYRMAIGLAGADSGGNLFVLDPPNSRIAVFDPNGQFLRYLGRGGGGPGEFQAPGSISVSAEGEVAVFDYGKGGLVRFAPDGAPRTEQRFALYPTPGAQRHFTRFRDTTFVSSSTLPLEPADLIQSLRMIAEADTMIVANLLLPSVQMVMYECGVGLPLPPVFAPELVWDTQAGTVVVGSSVEYSLSFFASGRLSRIVRRPLSPEAASRQDALRQLGEGFRINVRGSTCLIEPDEMVDKRGYSDIVPLIAMVYLGPSGELWVQRFTVDPDAAKPIDVFDRDGGYVGTVIEEGLSPLMLLPRDRVAAVETDADGVQRLVVYSIVR